MKGLAVIVMAAGLGTRMKSRKAKVLHTIAGRPMLAYTLDNVMALKPETVVAVTGHQSSEVRKLLPRGVINAHQKEQNGTGHAVSVGLKKLGGFKGTVMVVSGDTPLLGAGTLKRLAAGHMKSGAHVSVLTAVLDNPHGYGRIIRNGGRVAAIVEQTDATPAQKKINEINAGTYCFDAISLRAAIKKLGTKNAQAEFYLTDTVAITSENGGKVLGIEAASPDEALGINDRAGLAYAERVIRLRVNEALMRGGVSILDPETTYISPDASIGPDTVIYPGNHVLGSTKVGEGCTLMPGNVITDSTIGGSVTVKGYSVIEGSAVHDGASVGPFAHVRPGSEIGPDAKVGNFVELKKCRLGKGSKASHLSYLGDATIGTGVNVGAGTITCNYDGFDKYQTVIEDGVFVGSDTQFVAPVRVGKGAIIAAGTTLTEDVPKDALAISRVQQHNHPGWAKKKRESKAKKSKGNNSNK